MQKREASRKKRHQTEIQKRQALSSNRMFIIWIVNQEYRKTKCICVEWRYQWRRWRWRNEMSTNISFNGCLQNSAVKSNATKIAQTRPRLAEDQLKNVKSITQCCQNAISWCRAMHINFFQLSHRYISRSSLPEKAATKKTEINSALVQGYEIYLCWSLK